MGWSRNKERLETLCVEAALRSSRAGQSEKAAYHATKKAIRARAKEVGMSVALSEAENGLDVAQTATAIRLARYGGS